MAELERWHETLQTSSQVACPRSEKSHDAGGDGSLGQAGTAGSKVLAQLNLRVLRFSNADVLYKTDWVISRIAQVIKTGQHAADPSGSPL